MSTEEAEILDSTFPLENFKILEQLEQQKDYIRGTDILEAK